MTYCRPNAFGSSVPDFLKFGATRRAIVAILTVPTPKRAKVKAARKANRLRMFFEKR